MILKPVFRQDMVIALKQMEAQKKYYMKNDETLRELNNNIVTVMSRINGSLNNIMKAIRKR